MDIIKETEEKIKIEIDEIETTIKQEIEKVKTFGQKVGSYLSRHWYWMLILLIAYIAIDKAVDTMREKTTETTAAVTNINSMSDIDGVPMPGKQPEIAKNQIVIDKANEVKNYFILI